ncbi:MAG: division/cell wall cluster transcriptional repressor MraZ [Blastocatellia bacterium]
MSMLRGSYSARIDEKGRLKIPADFKRVLGQKYRAQDFFVTSLTGEYAWIYPMPEWEAIENRLAGFPLVDSPHRRFLDRTSYFGQIQQCDPQGRLLIHQMLRNVANLADEVTVLGHLTYMEVWSSEKFRQVRLVEQPFTLEDALRLSRAEV